MKKQLLVLSIAALMHLYVTACGNDDEGSDTTSDSDSNSDTDTDTGTEVDTGTDTGNDFGTFYALDPDPSKVNKLGLVVGISDYAGSGNDLSFCDEDATDWYNYLTARGYEVKVLGDTSPGNYPAYHELATKANVDTYIRNIMASADSNDMVAITYSGHGGGSGGSAMVFTHEMAGYSDTEFASALQANTNVGQLFVSFDTCSSGGMGPEIIETMGASAHCNTTCGPNGYGYDMSSMMNGAWTGTLVDQTLLNRFGGGNVPMEIAFDHASSIYPYGGADAPMMFDGDKAFPFYLTDVKTAWFQKAEAIPAHGRSTLAKYLNGYSTVQVTYTDWTDPKSDRKIETGDIKENSELKIALELLNPSQKLTDHCARCLFSHHLDFLDSFGDIVGRVGICYAPEQSDNHVGVFVKLSGDGNTLSRQGIVIPNAKDLVDIIENHL